MDAVSGAASIITVISLALGSTRAIYNIVSSIQSGSKRVQQMIISLEALLNLLQQLSENRDSFYLASDLPLLVKNCATSLKALEEKLKNLYSVTDTRAQKLIRDVKTTLHSQDLERMVAIVNQHVTALSVQIQIIEGQRGVSLSHSLSQIELSQRRIEFSLSNSAALRSMVSTMKQTNDSLTGLEATVETSNHGTCQLLEQLGTKMQDLSSISTKQGNTLNDTCNAILTLLTKQNNASVEKSSVDSNLTRVGRITGEVGRPDEGNQDAQDRQDDIQDAISRISELVDETEKTVCSVDAERIIDDLQCLFNQLSKPEYGNNKAHGRNKRRRESESRHDQREVERMKSLLTASQSVTINGKASRLWRTKNVKYESKSTGHEFETRIGTVNDRTCRKNLIASKWPEFYTGCLIDDPLEFWEVYFAIVPEGARTIQIEVALRQKILREGTLIERPVLLVSALLPHESKVSNLIRKGDLEGLVKSLSLKEVRLTDRDLDGRCLLHYALNSAQSKVCRFLIENGANVNFEETKFARNVRRLSGSFSALKRLPRSGPVNDAFKNQVDECFSSLKEAGAELIDDPISRFCTSVSPGRVVRSEL